MKKINKIFLFFGLLLLAVPLANSIPVPHGISGRIYELDGLTQINKKLNLLVYDIDYGQTIYGKTSDSGKYSVALNGENGNRIFIKIWNNYHESNLTVSLQGVMRNVDIFFNSSLPEIPPIIISVPKTEVLEDEEYIYQIEAEDENNDILTYSLVVNPNNTIIDSNSGVIRWTPNNDDVGHHHIILQVSDGLFFINQSFDIEVISVNDAPEIVSGPITSATEDQTYLYDVDAIDVDSPILHYNLIEKPDSMKIDELSGEITWLPTNDDVGNKPVTILVTDGYLNDTLSFFIDVINTNDDFVINSTPITSAVESQLYSYDVDAYDPDKTDTISYYLISAPEGMEINQFTGLINWVPKSSQTGENEVVVEISDGTTSQNHSFIINVIGVNDAPKIISEPIREALVFRLYSYQLNAIDPEGDNLSYYLVDAPSGMEINKDSGLIRWIPLLRHLGKNKVVVGVSDGELKSNQSFNITVSLFENNHGGGGGRRKSLTYSDDTTENKDKMADSAALELGNRQSTTINKVLAIKNRGTSKEFSVNAFDLSQRPSNTGTFDNKAYKYLEIIPLENTKEAQKIFIQFRVEEDWLKNNNAEEKDIVLYRYTNNKWIECITKYISEEDGYINYESEVLGFSYFAVSLNYSNNQNNFISTGPKEQHIISGTIFKNSVRIQVEKSTEIVLTNINLNKTITGKTGYPNQPGYYYLIIEGKNGDQIDLEVKFKNKMQKISFILGGDMKNIDLIVKSRGLEFITGNSISDNFSFVNLILSTFYLIIPFTILSILFYARIVLKKKIKSKKIKKLRKKRK